MNTQPPDRRPAWPRHPAVLAALLATLLTGCDRNPEPPPPALSTTLRGIAAIGGPVANATIRVIDADAATADPAPVSAGSDGRYAVDVSSLRAPLFVRATGSAGGESVDLVAVLGAVTAQTENTANVTPLTNAIAALVAPGGDPLALSDAASLTSNATPTRLANAGALVTNTLATDPAIAAALGSGFDPVQTPFNADGSGIDGVLDQLQVEVRSGGTVAITNLAAPVPPGGTPSPVLLTPAQADTPTVVPTLPPTAPSGNVPTAAELAAIGTRLQACFAQPASQRVTQQADGTVTAVSAACNLAPADWRSNGRNWVQEVGQFTLSKAYFDGATVGTGQVVLALGPANLSDPKVFRPPYCNDGPCAVVRWPLATAGGVVTQTEWVLGKTSAGWDLVGNQRPYRLFVEPRLLRKTAMNRAGASPGNTADPYFFRDRYESVLRIVFDPSVGDAANIRAWRVTGPGLPAAGVVAYRSQRCGTDDRFAIANQTGSTRVLGTTGFQFWTGNATAEFVLDAAHLDGSALALPVTNPTTGAFPDFSATPVANQSTTVPAWSLYRFELFHFDVLSDEPDEIVYVRTGTAAENAAAGASKAWPTLSAANANDYVTPTGARAGAIGDLAQTFDWTGVAGSHVGSGYLFSQNFAIATNAQGETANYGARSRIDFEPQRLGDTTGRGVAWAGVASGTSLSSFSANAGTNPNPRCGPTSLLPLTGAVSDYRELGLFFRGGDRKLYGAIWFWDN